MAKFLATVTETVAITKIYTVEADSIEEARDKAAIGDTEGEIEIRTEGVLDRAVEDIEPASAAERV